VREKKITVSSALPLKTENTLPKPAATPLQTRTPDYQTTVFIFPATTYTHFASHPPQRVSLLRYSLCAIGVLSRASFFNSLLPMDVFPSTAAGPISPPPLPLPLPLPQCPGLGSVARGVAGRVLCAVATCVFATGACLARSFLHAL
jgi:hypothetical protein